MRSGRRRLPRRRMSRQLARSVCAKAFVSRSSRSGDPRAGTGSSSTRPSIGPPRHRAIVRILPPGRTGRLSRRNRASRRPRAARPQRSLPDRAAARRRGKAVTESRLPLGGVYHCDADGAPIPSLSRRHSACRRRAARAAADRHHRLMKLLPRRGVPVEDTGLTCLAEPDGDGEEARTLRPLQAAVTYRSAFGRRFQPGRSGAHESDTSQKWALFPRLLWRKGCAKSGSNPFTSCSNLAAP